MLPVMRMIPPALILTVAALWSATAFAAPSPANDDITKMLADKGLLVQIGQVGQNVGHKASELVVNAMGFLGVPYKWGGNTAETGFDCSGFVRSVYEQSVGLLLPRKAEQQASATETISKSDLKPGDLVFFNTMRRAFSHVGIYVGDGKFIHAPKAGAEVRVESMSLSYWRHRFDGARRVAAAQSAPPEQSAAISAPPANVTASPSAALLKSFSDEGASLR